MAIRSADKPNTPDHWYWRDVPPRTSFGRTRDHRGWDMGGTWVRYPDAVRLNVYRVDHEFEFEEIRLVVAGMNSQGKALTNDVERKVQPGGWYCVFIW